MTPNNLISDVLIKIGNNVKKYRNERKMTQQELAYLSGNMERATISNIETYKSNGINLNTLIRISITLNVDFIDLLM